MKITINQNNYYIYFIHKVNDNAIVTKTKLLKNGNRIITNVIGKQVTTECYVVTEKDKEIVTAGVSTCSLLDNFDKRKAMHYSFRNALRNFQGEYISEIEADADFSQEMINIANIIGYFVEEFSKFRKNRNFYQFFYGMTKEEIFENKSIGI